MKNKPRPQAQLGDSDSPAAAIVMNANPFTNGHAALLERAATENARVVLFVLSEDCSLVPYADRLAMVKAAAARHDNVTVVLSGSYMISAATFPSYFLKDDETVTHTHALLDAALFVRIAQALHDFAPQARGLEHPCAGGRPSWSPSPGR